VDNLRDTGVRLALRGGKTGAGLKAAAIGLVVFIVGLLFIAPIVSPDNGAASAQAGCPVAGGGLLPPVTPGPEHAKQLANARIIAAQAGALKMPGKATLVAIMAGLAESSLLNLANGGLNTRHYAGVTQADLDRAKTSLTMPHEGVGNDADSAGIIQQRPSAGWGTVAQIMNPAYAARAFLIGPPGNPKGLAAVTGWQDLAPTAAIQRVQGSAFPGAYAGFEPEARTIAQEIGADLTKPGDPRGGLTGAAPIPAPASGSGAGSGQGCAPATGAAGPFARAAIDAARSQLGEPYVWAAGGYDGPTMGGFDCSGLMMYAFAQASGQRIHLPHSSQQQRSSGRRVAKKDLQPGDMIVFNLPGSTDGAWGHVGLDIGGGQMIHAPAEGQPVQVATIIGNTYWESGQWDIRRLS
jgi:cell wall-associated NlpC family hydrolase